MSRLAPLDRALVLILVPLWVVCFGLAVQAQLRGGGLAVVSLSLEDADSYPVLTGEYAEYFYESDPLAEAGLRAGDRLVRAGEVDLRGVGMLGLQARVRQAAGSSLRVPVLFERDGELRETSLRLASFADFARPQLVNAFWELIVALFLLFRARPTPTVRAYFHAALATAFVRTHYLGGELQSQVWVGTWVAAATLYFPTVLRFLMRFPDDRVPQGRWHRIWPWFFGVLGLFAFLMFLGPLAIAERGFTLTVLLGIVVALVVATRKYRSADRLARRQIKWVLFGVYGAALLPASAIALTTLDPRFGWLWWAAFWVPIIPLSILASIVRFNLFDVDRLLSTTASYNVLLVLLVAGVLVVVPRVADAVSGVVGVDAGTSQVLLSLALAAVLLPAHRRLRPQIERVFFKERYALDQGIAELLTTLSACDDARELTERVGRELQRLLRPEACVVYARVEESYTPVFAEGKAVPSAFATESPLIGTLRARRGPLSLSAEGRRPDGAALGPFDRAALETLGAEVVVPVRQSEGLPAFLCLGPKRSGDVYTSTDLSLLTAVAETVSRELRRFDQEQNLREAREMQESLRRYVPGAIADQLADGAELHSGEREVTVLFVDIRGYTGFAESRRAEEIFSTVNRYTETVSEIVRRHAGSVVEFNGDGMMAVFGAPRELAHKERAAVEAGREIVAAVGSLRVDGAQLSVGVGIATGEAFVGNIRAVDRMIWSAIGNTTNLAARLQGLTRELDAALVIDSTTWQRAQPAAAAFEQHPAVPIRGRRETQDVYGLSLTPARTD
jgi:class 3 adenylate cyclase